MSVQFDEKAAASLERSYRTPDVARQRAETLACLHPEPGAHLLDVGCGPGFLVREMADAVGAQGRAVGIDTSRQMLDLAERRITEVPQAEVAEAGVEAMPFPDAEFDAASCVQVLLFVPDPAKALGELNRVLKPSGRLAVIETDWRGAIVHAEDDALSRRMFAAWDAAQVNPNLPVRLKPMLENAGFADVTVTSLSLLNTEFGVENYSSGMLRVIANHAKRQGLASETEATGWIDEMKAKSAAGAYFFCVNRFLFLASKRAVG